MIASRELATARRWLIPIHASPGTSTTPPPTPNKPLTTPAKMPTPRPLAEGLPVAPGMATWSHAEHLAIDDEIRRGSRVDGADEGARRHGAHAAGAHHADMVEAVGSVPVGEVEGRQGPALTGIVGRAEVALDLGQGVRWRVPGVQRVAWLAIGEDVVVVVDHPGQVGVVGAAPLVGRRLRVAAVAGGEHRIDEMASVGDALEVGGRNGGIL